MVRVAAKLRDFFGLSACIDIISPCEMLSEEVKIPAYLHLAFCILGAGPEKDRY